MTGKFPRSPFEENARAALEHLVTEALKSEELPKWLVPRDARSSAARYFLGLEGEKQRSHWQHLKAGRKRISMNMMKHLVVRGGVSAHYLFTGQGNWKGAK